MKKSLVALALTGAFSASAFAQSAVEIYGVVDMGFVTEQGVPAVPTKSLAGGPIDKLTSGVQSGTRLGFKGTEDLGNNLKALFVLETGIDADTGGFNQGNTAFARQSFVGLQSDLGTLTLGRQYTPIFNTMMVADPFAAGMAGAAQSLMPTGGIRMNNTIKYTSPILPGGFSTEIAYGFGEAPNTTTTGQESSIAINYRVGDLKASLAYNDWSAAVPNSSPTAYAKRKDWFLAANYDLKFAKIFGGITDTNDLAPDRIRSNDYLVGVQIPYGKHTFIASYIAKNVRNVDERDASLIALGYTYSLSKRTNLYAAYGRIDNETNDPTKIFTVGNNSETGRGEKAFNLGLRHFF